MTEEALLFGKTGSLVGIVSDPSGSEHNNGLPGVILLNAGLVHRVGPNRLYVNMARALAAQGFVVLRFDFSGIGDSQVRSDTRPREKRAVDEVQDAMDLLAQRRGIDRFLLMGICSGATDSFNTACQDSRVVGAVLINLLGYEQQVVSYVRSSRYWKTRLFAPKYWVRPLLGRGNYRLWFSRLRDVLQKRSASFAARDIAADFRALTLRGVRLLYILGSADISLEYFEIVLGSTANELTESGKLRVEVIQQTDHLFTPLRSQQLLLEIVQDWIQGMAQSRILERTALAE